MPSGSANNFREDSWQFGNPTEHSSVGVCWERIRRITAFNLYRVAGDKLPVKVNAEPLTGATNFLDEDAPVDGKLQYFVRPVVAGTELDPSASAPVWNENYLDIPIVPIDGYHPGDASVGDLDGDGELEIVLHQTKDARDNSHTGITGTPILDAYKLDGTHLWRIDLGKNIRDGEHYTQFMVYDLDGDGRAEIACKTADGTVDGVGKVIGDAEKDYRDQRRTESHPTVAFSKGPSSSRSSTARPAPRSTRSTTFRVAIPSTAGAASAAMPRTTTTAIAAIASWPAWPISMASGPASSCAAACTAES